MNSEQNIIFYNTADGKAKVALFAKDGNIWMNQNQLSELFATSKQNIGQHIASILNDNELDEDSVVKNYFTTAADGKQYNVNFYSLDMIQTDEYDIEELKHIENEIKNNIGNDAKNSW
ncbi:MAG: hypothetical protein A2033_07325 [Bacteroidetes bacterium GWA2_31_9]|nr:MAG: hypothetical protein A2033_07325 [Bacteroidetes bacterium GWA2_31_9]